MSAGFSRIEPAPADPVIGYAQLWGKPRPEGFAEHSTDDWLPGYQVFGEGLLCVLDPDAVAASAYGAGQDTRLVAAARCALTLHEPAQPLPWLLAHTLAHLVMRAAAPARRIPTSVSARAIFAVDNRTGFLVYTAAGDVHGAIGGLVELGTPERLSELLDAAVDAATWCATDPVCGEDAQGPADAAQPQARVTTACSSRRRRVRRSTMGSTAQFNGHGNVPGFLV